MDKREYREFMTGFKPHEHPHYAPHLNQVDPEKFAQSKNKWKGAPSMGSNPHPSGFSYPALLRTRSLSTGSEGEPSSPVGSPVTTPPILTAMKPNVVPSLATNEKIKELRHEFDFK